MTSRLRGAWLRTRMRATASRDRARLRALMAQHPGLDIHPSASTAFAVATFHLHPGARLQLASGVATERRPDAVRFDIRPGGELVIEPGTWLRTELAPVVINVYEGARMHIGPGCLLNGCQISAKRGVRIGRECGIGPGVRIWDSDQHDLDADRPEQTSPIELGDYVWLASDVTVLRGVRIGEQSVVGARSLVTRSLPPHSLAYGVPAKARGKVGDRSLNPL